MKVLVCAKDPALRARVARILQRGGHAVTWVSNPMVAGRVVQADIQLLLLERDLDLREQAGTVPVLLIAQPLPLELAASIEAIAKTYEDTKR